ncbi:hypothetical protein H6P81_002685 [Aristolochia fimbriata]|uniref:Aminotransferase-like plant mobile domain-containing protein n=1 Tax=Aristolochia fimbriata TaxID=158543 RepID=A0AAV7FEJ9_ARIFI|nr:hypothetical protein H6P81_002685 [Aristolochia fimbriata]
MDERMLPYVEAAGFGALHRVQWLRLDKPLITALVERWRSETNTFHLANGEMTITLEDVGILLGLRGRREILWTGRLGGLDGVGRVTPPEDVEHVTRISRKGRAGEDWALYHRDYIAWWEAQEESVVMGSRAHTPRHAPSDYMRWYLGATRRFIAPPPTEPAMVYHPRDWVCKERGWRVNHRAALYPSSTDPHWLEIGTRSSVRSPRSSTLGGSDVGGDVSHAGEPSHVVEPARERAPRQRRARRRPTAQTKTSVEDSDEVPAVPEPTVLDLPPEQTPDTEPSPPLEQPLEQPEEPEPGRHPPIRRIYNEKAQKAIGARA